MYGLYRAWFGGGAANNYPCLQDTFSPPDTVVRVGNEGEHQFVAHKGVLAAHSGYLKALLASAAATTTMTIPSSSAEGGSGGSSASANFSPFDPACATVAAVTIGQSQRSQPVTSVSVSSVGGEAFAPLLNYMYTGRLEVTLDNVYSVLLATHLLHMPGALEQCRAALLRLRAPPALPIPVPTSASTATTSSPGSGNILRPIPSRLLVGPPLCWPSTGPLYPPTAPATASVAMSHLPQIPPSMLMQPTVSPSINVVASGARDKQEQCAHYSANKAAAKSPQSSPTRTAPHRKRQRPSSRSRTPEIVSTVALPFVAAAAAAFTAFAVTSGATDSTRASSPSRSISPALSTASRTHSPTTATVSSQQRRHKSLIAMTSERELEAHQRQIASTGRSCNDQSRKSTSSDDGAIRGRGNNGSNNGDTTSEHSDRARSSRRRARSSGTSGAKEATGGGSSTSSNTSTVFSVVYDIACCDGPVRFHRVLNENYSSSTSAYGAPTRAASQHRNCPPDVEDLSSENDENGGPTTTTMMTTMMTTMTTTTTTTTTTTMTMTRGAGGILSDSSNDSSNNGATAANNPVGNTCYTCGYCKHTFKSQYCYRKHAKRHLLPTRINETVDSDAANGSTGSTGSRQETAGRNRREVRLLDLNVQYYPCKICGCKFPSYYFVHKHRKLCHANDEEGQATAPATGTAAATRDAADAP